MWARTAEVMLALWLAVSPFVFRHPEGAVFAWANDFGCAFVVLVLSLASFHRRFRRAHLLNLAVAVWLVAVGWAGARAGEAGLNQNHVTVGLILLMLAVVPSDASRPPLAWREELREHPS